jgi:thymidylate synthase (FAD)
LNVGWRILREQKPKITILCVNGRGERISACAARLSTTKRGAGELFFAPEDADADRALIGKVLKSGHLSLLEHIVFNLAVSASAFAEQFFIEFRLASFTVKSRRYVDFSEAGFYMPLFDGEAPRSRYQRFTDAAAGVYKRLINAGVPKEDARFALPYGFISEFYCTVNARELLLMLSRMGGNSELAELREQLLAQMEDVCPSVFRAYAGAKPAAHFPKLSASADKVEILQMSDSFDKVLAASGEGEPLKALKSARPRVLEHFNCTFRFNGISLAALTHIARHRIQSLYAPGLMFTDARRFVKPRSIAESGLAEVYGSVFSMSGELARDYVTPDNINDTAPYLALSGSLTDILITMNARELSLFFKLRACGRAQWEIREFVGELLRALRQKHPDLFNRMGPSCFAEGFCPEGKLTCGKINEMRALYGAADE